MPYLGNEPATAYTSTTKDSFSGDGSTTAFTMSKSANVNAVRVVVENVVQDPSVAYTCSGTTLTFTSAPPSGTNNIYVVHLGPPAATVAPPTTINNETTFTGGVTLKNETPEDTDGGRESIVTFQGTQSGSEISTLAQIQASHDGTSDDEKGDLIFKTNDGNDGASPTERLRLDSVGSLGLGTSIPASSSAGVYLTGGGATYSTGSTYRYDMVNAYFDTSASAWKYIGNGVGTQIYQANGDFVFNNAANNTSGAGASLTWVEAMRIKETAAHGTGLGIGIDTPLRQLHISNTSANSEIAFTAGTSGVSSILFGDGQTGTDVYKGYIQYNHSSDSLLFASDASTAAVINSGNVFEKYGNSTSARIIPQSDNAGYLGESSHRWQAVYAVNGSIQTSDRNLKTEITNSALGLDFVKALRPVSYKWISGGKHFEYDEEDVRKENPTITDVAGKRNHYGLIAQEVKEALGDTDFGGWVSEDVTDENATQSLRYDQFIAPLIKAVQELSAKVDTLETENTAIKARLDALEAG